MTKADRETLAFIGRRVDGLLMFAFFQTCIALLAFLILVVAPRTAAAITPTFNPEPKMVIVDVKWASLKDTIENCIALGAWDDPAAARRMPYAGCATMSKVRNEDGTLDDQIVYCTIHAVRPTVMNDRETLVLGHEILHCFLGRYHPQ